MGGGSGADFMSGGDGNDTYYHFRGDGIDHINDNQYSNGSQGAGSGNDTIRMNYSSSEILFFTQPGDNHLYISTHADISDGYFDEGLVVENFFLNGNYVVELLITSDNVNVDLTIFL